MDIFIETVIGLFYIILVLKLSNLFVNFGKEFSRKCAHIMVSNWWFIAIYFNNYFSGIAVPLIMAIIMCLSYKFHIFNGIERENQHLSFGTIYFFLGLVLLIALAYCLNKPINQLGIFFMPLAYGDSFAAIFGKLFNWHNYKILKCTKSLSGNIAMFAFSLISIYIYNYFLLNQYNLPQIMFIAIIATIVEGISVKGSDNITIPIISALICEVIL